MLSNFQYGNQALLQTFLVGQPEFRAILQRPEMEQFRQRVAATCHIGPLDVDETRGYIEHRLKRAGATDKPTFESEVFVKVHEASHGIPRQINAICDRLLLLGFLCERSHLTVADVEEVLREFASESEVPNKAASALANREGVNGSDSMLPADTALDQLDLDKLRLDPALARGIGQQIEALGSAHAIDQLQRLERSILRLERANVQTLGMLKKLVSAVKKASAEDTH